MLTRREILFGGALALVSMSREACSCQAETLQSQRASGCLIEGLDLQRIYSRRAETQLYVSGEEPMIMKSGNPDFDFALARTLGKCGNVFGVRPGFAYFNDVARMNAYATSQARLKGTDGTVLFGQHLFRKLMARPVHPDVSVAAVCVHEFGHIVQFKLGIFETIKGSQPTIKRVELHADFLSGYFAGVRRTERPEFPASVVTATMGSLGDDLESSSSHHGTPNERKAAVVQGFKVSFDEKRTFAEAVQIGMNFVSRA
jgi:hypothetical protein